MTLVGEELILILLILDGDILPDRLSSFILSIMTFHR